MKMIVVRHGYYNRGTGSLDETGRTQIRQLAERLKPQLEGFRVWIFSSDADRAVQSAEILAVKLNGTLQVTEKLGISRNYLRNAEELLKVISVYPETNAVILVTHEPAIMPILFAYRQQNQTFAIKDVRVNTGEAILIDSGQEPANIEFV